MRTFLAVFFAILAAAAVIALAVKLWNTHQSHSDARAKADELKRQVLVFASLCSTVPEDFRRERAEVMNADLRTYERLLTEAGDDLYEVEMARAALENQFYLKGCYPSPGFGSAGSTPRGPRLGHQTPSKPRSRRPSEARERAEEFKSEILAYAQRCASAAPDNLLSIALTLNTRVDTYRNLLAEAGEDDTQVEIAVFSLLDELRDKGCFCGSGSPCAEASTENQN